jgi:hypothetical protein
MHELLPHTTPPLRPRMQPDAPAKLELLMTNGNLDYRIGNWAGSTRE